MTTAKHEHTESRHYGKLPQQNRHWNKQQIPSRRRCPRRPYDDGDNASAGRYVPDGHEHEGGIPARATDQRAETDQCTEKRGNDGGHGR